MSSGAVNDNGSDDGVSKARAGSSPPVAFEEEQRRRTLEMNKKTAAALKKQTSRTVIKFDASNIGEADMTFQKEDVRKSSPPKTPRSSGLTRALVTDDSLTNESTWSAGSSPVRHRQTIDGLQWDTTGPMVELTIHIAASRVITVHVPSAATVHAVIKYVIMVNNARVIESKGDERDLLNREAEFYVLRLADDDGHPDDDFPPLNPARQIKAVKMTEFALAENPKWRGAKTPERAIRARASSRASRASASISARSPPPAPPGRSSGASGSGAGANGSVGSVAARRASEASRKSAAARDPTQSPKPKVRPSKLTTKDNVLITVHFPTGEYMMVQFRRDVLVMEMLQYIARRRGLPAEGWALVSADKVPHHVESTLDSLGIDEVWLVKEENVKDTPRRIDKSSGGSAVPRIDDSDLPESFMFNEALASQFKEYEVIKVNRHGRRQERILGIDRDNVYNDLRPEGSGKSGLFSNRPKTPKRTRRPMDTVIGIGLSENEPGHFWMDFRDDTLKDGHKVYMYEARSSQEAAEIVAKVLFIMKMLQKK